MTLIELIIFIANVGFIAAACLFGAQYGLLGAIVGGIAGIAILVVFYATLLAVAAWLHQFYPAQPLCRNGACGLGDYEWLPSKDGFLVCRCKCGCCYIIKGHRFLELLSDGSTRPFMSPNDPGPLEDR